MLKESLTIIKVDGKNCFLDISASAFTLAKEGDSKDGKVVFMFRNYDQSKPAGQRMTDEVDFYMCLEEFAVFCESLKSGRYGRLLKQNEEKAKASGNNFVEPAYKKLGGSEKDGNVTSRQMQLIKGMKSAFVLQVLQGPGEWDKNHRLMVPRYNYKTATDKVTIPLDADTCIKIGIAGERAIQMYDTWVAMGVLDEKVEALRTAYKKNNAGNSANTSSPKPKQETKAETVQKSAPQPMAQYDDEEF